MTVYDPVITLCRIDALDVLRETPKFYVFKQSWGGKECKVRKRPGRAPGGRAAERRREGITICRYRHTTSHDTPMSDNSQNR